VTPDWIGWMATVVFVASYACRNSLTLRRIQAVAALLWLASGWAIGSAPVIVANLIVAGAALVSSRERPARFGAEG
jgi:Bacterial inner membrane protein